MLTCITYKAGRREMQKVVAGRAANSPATSNKMRLFHTSTETLPRNNPTLKNTRLSPIYIHIMNFSEIADTVNGDDTPVGADLSCLSPIYRPRGTHRNSYP